MSRLVLSCSLHQLEDAQRAALKLNAAGIPCVLPRPGEIDSHAGNDSKFRESAEFIAYKRRVALRYFDIIREPETIAVLAINPATQHRPANYIGTSSFAELAVAAAHRLPVIVLYDLYPPLAEDLRSFNARPLKGQLDALIEGWARLEAGERPAEPGSPSASG